MIKAGRILAAALALAAFQATVAPARPAPAASARVNWNRTFAATGAGGFRVGNPSAKFAIVEYGSLTCPHCRHFAETAVKPLLDQYVRSGKASYEFRPFILNGTDLAATLVARCNGPAPFFAIADQLYATQPTWSVKVSELSQAEQDKLNALPDDQMRLGIAKVTGLYAIAASHGISQARAQQCLKDARMADRLMAIMKRGEDLGVTGTPSFFINGKRAPVYDWATLETFLKGAGG